MYRFIHAADLHLDSPLVGLERYESAPVQAARGSTRRAFTRLIDFAIEESISFVLIAGDLYDGDWKDYNTGLFFVEQMTRLAAADIRVFVVAGNHDAASQLTKSLRPPSNVHVFSGKNPETIILSELGVAIHGQSFMTRAVSEDLASGFPRAIDGQFNIGMLHTSLDGREGHGSYAPTTRKVLERMGYEYWALGHVHAREIISEDPWIVFPGILQGRHAREVGAKSFTLVSVDCGKVLRVEERHVDVLRWAERSISVDGATSTSEILDKVENALSDLAESADGRAIAVRIEIVGDTRCAGEIAANPFHWVQEVRALASSITSADIWTERVRFRIREPDNVKGSSLFENEAVRSLFAPLDSEQKNEAERQAFREALADIYAAAPEIRDGEARLDLSAGEEFERIIVEAQELLRARLEREIAQP